MRAFNDREKEIIRRLVNLRAEFNGNTFDFLSQYVYDQESNAGLLFEFGKRELYLLEPIDPAYDPNVDESHPEINRFYELLSLIIYLKEERFIWLYSVEDSPAMEPELWIGVGKSRGRSNPNHAAISMGSECYRLACEHFLTRIHISQDLKELVKEGFVTCEEKRFSQQKRQAWTAIWVALGIGVASIVASVLK